MSATTTHTSGAARYVLVALAYLLWFANGALSVLLLVLARQFLLRLFVVFRWDPYAMGAVDKLGLLLLGVLWLGWVIYAEQWYRTAALAGVAALARAAWRTLLVVGVPLMALAVALVALRA